MQDYLQHWARVHPILARASDPRSRREDLCRSAERGQGLMKSLLLTSADQHAKKGAQMSVCALVGS